MGGEVATVDWVGITGILGTLGGVVVGAFGTWIVQHRQLKHADDTRFQEQRMEAYTNYLIALSRVLAAIKMGDWDNESTNQALSAYEVIEMIGSPETVRLADEVHKILVSTFHPKPDERKRKAEAALEGLTTAVPELEERRGVNYGLT